MGFFDRLFNRKPQPPLPSGQRKPQLGSKAGGGSPPGIQFDVADQEPDSPQGFGYKIAWLAVRSDSPATVASEIGLQGLAPCNWRAGLKHAYDSKGRAVFITPPLDGWVLATGWAMDPGEEYAETVPPILQKMSDQFQDAQFFLTHRVVELHVWAKAENGALVRGFGVVEGIQRIWDVGPLTTEEENWNANFADPDSAEAKNDPNYWDRADLEYPGEEHVIKLAAAWSIDPTTIDDRFTSPTLGLIGTRPPA
ncbi:MAG: hypothetical protein KDB90_08005 [Planctomycetes bacterium]|nr:hypothetical protein [Planctomycetota bacterium]